VPSIASLATNIVQSLFFLFWRHGCFSLATNMTLPTSLFGIAGNLTAAGKWIGKSRPVACRAALKQRTPHRAGAESQGSRKDVRSMRPFYGVAIRVAARCRIHMVVDAATSAAPKSNKRYAIHDGW
jgi:hypothetical protein